MPSTATPLQQLEAWPVLAALKSNAVLYPSLEVVHISALALVFGSICLVDLRILGAMKRLPLADTLHSILPWTIGAFALAALSGLAMFVLRISDFISNPMFIAKICLLFAVGTNAAILHARGAVDSTSVITRAQAALSISLWGAIIFCGRWIAYV